MTADVLPPLNAESVGAALATRWLGRRFEWHARCASTSDLAAERARAGAPAGLTIAADTQTNGRGRLGRSWHSPAGENLYFSLLLRPRRAAAEIPPLTLLAGAAIAQALAPLGVAPRLKWPNDVQLVDGAGRRRKLAGVLTEMASAGERVEHVVVGVGINVNTTAFPDELAEGATSLRVALGQPQQPIDRTRVLAAVLNAFEPLYDEFERRGPAVAVEAFGAWSALPERCRIDDRLQGVALGVDPDGALRLRDDAGQIHRVISGEVHS
jgi:BirA family transcriptional regulator, biotin operon repressor / biotin---[acetyl-CoA-carboxylase] ligase